MRMNQNRAFENHYGCLQSITDKVITYSKNFEGLLTTVYGFYLYLYADLILFHFFKDNFLPLIDLFQKETIKLEICKNIMTACKNKTEGNFNDPVVTNALMYICRILNDSVK